MISAQSTLPAFWTFINPSPGPDSFGGPIGWKTKLDLRISGSTPYVYSTGSDGNAACRLDEKGEYVQVNISGKPGPVSYYLRGTGFNPSPAFSGQFTIEESSDGNTWNPLRILTTMKSSFERFEDLPSETARFIRFYYTDKQSGSNVALDSVLIKAAPAEPFANLRVVNKLVEYVNSSELFTGNDTLINLEIENTGNLDTLYISQINLSGVNSNEFTLLNSIDKLAPLSSAGLLLKFSSTNTGSNFCTLNIQSNSIENSVYELNLYSISGKYATEPKSQAANLVIDNLSAHGLKVHFDAAANSAESYLVLRNVSSDPSEVPMDGETYLKGDRIGNSVVAYSGKFTSFTPGYIIANQRYKFTVFSFNGRSGFENYNTASPLSGAAETPGKNYGNYYNGIKTGDPDFLTNLSKLINLHDTIFYSNYSSALIDPLVSVDTSGGKKYVKCVYTGIANPYAEPFVWWGNGSSGTLTREHTFAQSWMPSNKGAGWPNDANGKELPEYNDLHNLFPTDQLYANVKRSNLPFGDVVGQATYISPTGQGKIGQNKDGVTVFEPMQEQKGNVSRAIFYMCVAYNGINGNSWKLPSNQDQEVLKKWHFGDLPDALEIARNELIYKLQKNRNPFIDSLDFVKIIDFSAMSYLGDSAITVKDIQPGKLVSIYPNPSQTGHFMFRSSEKTHLIVTDALGKLMYHNETPEYEHRIDLSEFAPGLYYLQTKNGYHKLLKR
ncbi:MAG: endonuclease [Flavobacteriales bacterium]|nr:endonuclease [Flavobacteriales bacterium]